MELPYGEMKQPSVLAGRSNGRLPPEILWATPGLAGGPVVYMVPPAARAWRALSAAAEKAGHLLKMTSLYDSYRPYSVQVSTFRARYTTEILPDRPRKWWEGKYWYQLPNTAVAATPGSSNHGWGLAGDVANAFGAKLDWLVANELRFGFSHELDSEPWHIRYFAGDVVPAAVLAYEDETVTDPFQNPSKYASADGKTRTQDQKVQDLEETVRFGVKFGTAPNYLIDSLEELKRELRRFVHWWAPRRRPAMV